MNKHREWASQMENVVLSSPPWVTRPIKLWPGDRHLPGNQCTHSDCRSPAEGLCPAGWGCKMTPDSEDGGGVWNQEPHKAGLQSWTPQLLVVWPLWTFQSSSVKWALEYHPAWLAGGGLNAKWDVVCTLLSTVSRGSSLSPSMRERNG